MSLPSISFEQETHFDLVMVAMVLPVESLSCSPFLLEAYFLIDLDSRLIVCHHCQSYPVESSLLRQLDRSLHHQRSQPEVLKVLMDVDEKFADAFAPGEGHSEQA